jgi:hypothetical protein
LGSNIAWCNDEALSDLPPILPDPSLATSIRLPPGLANAGVAQAGPALSATVHLGAHAPCSGINPCAMATPAADHVPPAR